MCYLHVGASTIGITIDKVRKLFWWLKAYHHHHPYYPSFLNGPRSLVVIMGFSIPTWHEGHIEVISLTIIFYLLTLLSVSLQLVFTNIHFIKFLVESQLMQILLLIKFQSASLCNFKTFSTNYILITIKIFLDLSFSASKMSGIVSGLIFKVKHNFPVANKYRSELVILDHSCQSMYRHPDCSYISSEWIFLNSCTALKKLQVYYQINFIIIIYCPFFTNDENLFKQSYLHCRRLISTWLYTWSLMMMNIIWYVLLTYYI